jgi:uncharacterized protein DUF4062/NACHT domain-containing protein
MSVWTARLRVSSHFIKLMVQTAAKRVFVSHTSDFGERADRSSAYVSAALIAIARAECVASEMSFFPASDLSPAALSAELTSDSDYYVGIIGWRYGSLVRESPGISYTQLEFRVARDAGVPRLMFLLDSDDRTDADPKQLQFRQEILDSGVTVQTFGTPDALDARIYQALVGGSLWDPALGKAYFEAVRSVLAKRHLAPNLLARASRSAPVAGRWRVESRDRSRDKSVDDACAVAVAADRLVLLGGPGSGKSHIARQAAIAVATSGLDQLVQSKATRDVEVPLYATVSAFVRVYASAESAWEALVRAAMTEVESGFSDVRTLQRLKLVFGRRKERFFVVLDGLDEAGRVDGVNLHALLGALCGRGCRLLLTSRPAAWHGQLALEPAEEDAAAKPPRAPIAAEPRSGVLELMPLQPAEVDALIRACLTEAAATKLIEEVHNRRDLREAARVPIIALMCCAITAEGEIPKTRYELYRRAINRVLAGPWRDQFPDDLAPLEEARRVAAEAAWKAAQRDDDLTTGLANWDDEVQLETGRVLSESARLALDHLLPVAARNFDTLTERRRFLHQTFREHLVAETIVGLPTEEAVAVMRPHLWCDPFWEDVIPTAIAQHPQRTDIVRSLVLMKDVTESYIMVLARVATESPRSDWDQEPRLAGLIQRCLDVLALERALPGHNARYRALGWIYPGRDAMVEAVKGGDVPRRGELKLADFTEETQQDLVRALSERVVARDVISKTGVIGSREKLAEALLEVTDVRRVASVAGRLIEMFHTEANARRIGPALDVLAAIHRLGMPEAQLAPLMDLCLDQLEDAALPFGVRSFAIRALLKLPLSPRQRIRVGDIVFVLLRDCKDKYDLPRFCEAVEQLDFEPQRRIDFAVAQLQAATGWLRKRDRDAYQMWSWILSHLSNQIVDASVMKYLASVSPDDLDVAVLPELARRCSSAARVEAASFLLAHGDLLNWRFSRLRDLIACAPDFERRGAANRLIERLERDPASYPYFIEFLDLETDQRTRVIDLLVDRFKRTATWGYAHPLAAAIVHLKPSRSECGPALEIARQRLRASDVASLGNWVTTIVALLGSDVIEAQDRNAILDVFSREREWEDLEGIDVLSKHGGFNAQQVGHLLDALLPTRTEALVDICKTLRRVEQVVELVRGSVQGSRRVTHLLVRLGRAAVDLPWTERDYEAAEWFKSQFYTLIRLNAPTRYRRYVAHKTFNLTLRLWQVHGFIEAWQELGADAGLALRAAHGLSNAFGAEGFSDFDQRLIAWTVDRLLGVQKSGPIAAAAIQGAMAAGESSAAADLFRLGLKVAPASRRVAAVVAIAAHLRGQSADRQKVVVKGLHGIELDPSELDLLIDALRAPEARLSATEQAGLLLPFAPTIDQRANLADAVVEQIVKERLSADTAKRLLEDLPLSAAHALKIAPAARTLRTFVYNKVRHSLPFESWYALVTTAALP